jgi:hypothetical protein
MLRPSRDFGSPASSGISKLSGGAKPSTRKSHFLEKILRPRPEIETANPAKANDLSMPKEKKPRPPQHQSRQPGKQSPCIPDQALEQATIRDAANYSKSSRSYRLVVNGEMLFAGQALRWPMFWLAADAPALQLQDAAR